jgi:uncharacterized protein
MTNAETARAATSDARPVPVADGDSAPYWDAARAHTLMLPYCEGCGRYIFPPRPLCGGCLNAPEWRQLDGNGTIYSFTIMRDSFMRGFPPPYVVAEVELDVQPGLRIVANVVDCAVEAVHIGQPVVVTFEDRGENVTVPQFRPRSG